MSGITLGSEHWAMGHEFEPRWGQNIFRLEYNTYTQKLSEEANKFNVKSGWKLWLATPFTNGKRMNWPKFWIHKLQNYLVNT